MMSDRFQIELLRADLDMLTRAHKDLLRDQEMILEEIDVVEKAIVKIKTTLELLKTETN